ncbi:MAG: excinuclease ABC subunit UvrA [Wenzhouxiangellaceae bacterium]|nr:excinuclease ABC subunit UvrA [Wenzhouxiangellaceae bacterium]
MDKIVIRGARTHNLANIDLELPRDRLIVFTGLSGSGKSSLAFDTIYAEGQRRYVESLSAYARQFLSMMQKPDLDHIEGLSPAISIEQKAASHNPRSTVGTVTEIHDYLRLMFARVGTPRCPEHGVTLDAQTVSQMVDTILNLPEGTKLMLLAPVVRNRKGEHANLLRDLRAQGFVRVRIDGTVYDLDGELPALSLRQKHSIEAVVDRFRVRDPDTEAGASLAQRLAESLETALAIADGIALVAPMHFPDPDPPAEGKVDSDEPGAKIAEILFSARFACPVCDYSLPELEPRMFSFNNPNGACPACDGIGRKQFFDPARVVANPELSLAGGAIRGWDRRNAYYFQMIQSLGRHYGFEPETPFGELPEAVRDVVLHGSGNEKIAFRYFAEGGTQTRKHPFVGIIPNLERRYRETDSRIVREELSRYISEQPCPECGGQRLNAAARNVLIDGVSLPELASWSIEQCLDFFSGLELAGWRGEIAGRILKEVRERLTFLINVGLDYLTLDRQADTLSGGEAQRIRLASQIGAGLVGVMYVLDEPSIGLHQRDNARLLETLERLRDLGNTVIVVEHDEEAIRAADHIVDIGPGPGVHGGQIVYSGPPDGVEECDGSLTGDYLSGRRQIETPARRVRARKNRVFRLEGATGNNLKSVDVELPAGLFVCVTGVSGSGKSTLINETVYKLMARELNGASENPSPFTRHAGLDLFDKVVDIDQSPIGRTPRSNPATYTGLFTPIRELFAGTREARSRGYKPGRFSFNVKGGRCEACQGDGMVRVEMHFLPDIFVPCDVCHGKRYNRETLTVTYKGKNISEVLEMTVEDALGFFAPVPAVARKLQTLMDVGLSYITLGQSAVTLSGGEAQRIKLARELSKRDTGNTLYILDEPTTGLHFHDIKHLLAVLHRLRDDGNTVVVIEHNLDVIKTADWIIDLGPEGGVRGGEIIATGTPEQIAREKRSWTGRYLAQMPGFRRGRRKAG